MILKEERFKLIMKQINLHNKVLSVDLSMLLNVSEDTIRGDSELADGGHCQGHGGNQQFTCQTFHRRSNIYSIEEKKVIAPKAVKLIENNMTMLFEGGTTISELSKIIPGNLNLTIFTISPQIAIALSDHANVRVITIGGDLKKNHNIHVGSHTINELHRVKFDLCFMGVNAISVERGMTDIDMDVVEVNKAMFEVSDRNNLLTIAEKLNLSKRHQVSDLSDVDYLITELDVNNPLLDSFRKHYGHISII